MRSAILSLLLALALIANCAAQVTKQAILVLRHGEDVDNKAKNDRGQYYGSPATAPNNRPWYDTSIAPQKFYYEGDTNPYEVPFPANWHSNVCDTWPAYFANSNGIRPFGNNSAMSYQDQVTAVQHGLSGEANAGNTNFTNPYLGEFQAEALATYLDDFVTNTDALGCAPIARLFTKDARKKGSSYPTPNPFDTIYPYYKAHTNTMLYVSRTATDFTGGMFDAIKANLFSITTTNLPDLLASPGSAMICWDRQGLWGGSGGNNSADSILSKLYDTNAFNLPKSERDKINALGQPGKASRIYAFILAKNGTNVSKSVKVYNLVYSNTSGTGYPPTYSVQFNQVFPSR